MKKRITILSAILLSCLFLGACGEKETQQDALQEEQTAEETVIDSDSEGTESKDTESVDETVEEIAEENGESAEETACELADGIYTVDFDTDSSMFHVSEACEGKGTLTVEKGKMTIHISLSSKNIVNLYPGLAEDAEKEGAVLLNPTLDTVTYSDGLTEEVNGFDVPVPALDQEFDLALIGKKAKWYDHKVKVSNPEPEDSGESEEKENVIADGYYSVDITFEGGSGKAYILSPAYVTVYENKYTATLTWSSPNYDYMIVGGEKFEPINTEGNSVFDVPIPALDEPITVIGDTVAMSKPHEIEYTITFHSDTMEEIAVCGTDAK